MLYDELNIIILCYNRELCLIILHKYNLNVSCNVVYFGTVIQNKLMCNICVLQKNTFFF